MTQVQTIEVTKEEAELRLDRWFKRHFPGLSHARLSKLLRTGQVRVDGGRARGDLRLNAGSAIRVPPLGEEEKRAPAPRTRPAIAPSEHELEVARHWVIHRDDAIIALNKPPGLAVQGGSGLGTHLDALLDGLRFGAPERPRLVHRLDRDTSGVIVLARSTATARRLTEAFRRRAPRKVYWALVIGVPHPLSGRIDAALAKRPGQGGEKMMVTGRGEGQGATTFYRVIDAAAPRAAWLALMPKTGRTHQLRVHCAEVLGTPIIGDGKYGGAAAYLPLEGIERRLHLHARALELPDLADPSGRRTLRLVAEPPPHMAKAFKLLGLDLSLARDPFAALES